MREVLSHKMKDDSERPVGSSSHILAVSECNDSQLEKEGLPCIFGIKHFHEYLFRHSFQLITDYFSVYLRRIKLQCTSARIIQWSMFLSNYEYQLIFRSTEAHANADALSRFPLLTERAKEAMELELVLLVEHLADSPVTAKVQNCTQHNAILFQVLHMYVSPIPCSPD